MYGYRENTTDFIVATTIVPIIYRSLFEMLWAEVLPSFKPTSSTIQQMYGDIEFALIE